jgi:hypothetical protein
MAVARRLALDQPPVALGAARERGEVDALQARVAGGVGGEGPPEGALALDPEREPLELDDAAEGRVAGDPAVELEPAELLRQPSGPDLRRMRATPMRTITSTSASRSSAISSASRPSGASKSVPRLAPCARRASSSPRDGR